MSIGIAARVVVALALACTSVYAQTAPQAAAPAEELPTPLFPLEVTDADYPIDSLLAAEEGRVVLNVQIGADGLVQNVFVEGSSGFPRLDAAAAYFAKARWRFKTSISATIRVVVPWNIPIAGAERYVIYVPAPAQGTAAATRRPPPPNAPVVNDYPDPALRLGEQGIAGVTYRVLENGTVGEVRIVETSGSPRLDEAVYRMLVDRWRFEPARFDGKPVATFRSSAVAFIIPGAPPTRACHRRPVIAQEETRIFGRLDFAADAPVQRLINKWVFVGADGMVADALLLTGKGWVHLGRRGAERVTGGAAFPRPSNPEGCWYFDPVPIAG